MTRASLLSAIFLMFLPLLLFGKNEFDYSKIRQGDWAVVLVRGLNLDENRELVKLDDFTALLNENGIAPKDGWQANQKLTYQDFAGTIGLTLIYLNSADSEKKTGKFNNFLSFLDNKIGLNVAQLQTILQRNENLKNLSEGISNYLAQKRQPGSSDTNQEPPANSAPSGNTQSQAARSSNPTLASAAALIEDLADALATRDTGLPGNYWKVFSEPASPVLPNQTAP